MVSAWPEPPDVMSLDPSAGARCGVQGTFAIVGFIETPPPFLEACGRLQAAITELKKVEQGSNAPLPSGPVFVPLRITGVLNLLWASYL